MFLLTLRTLRNLDARTANRRPDKRRPTTTRNVSPWVEVLEQRALLSFLPPVSYPVGYNPASVAVGDFNGDGIPDLAVANSGIGINNGSVSVLLGNGDGTFQPARNFTTGNGPQSVAVGDFNGDGKLDIVTANYFSGTVGVLLGNGDGTFQAARTFAAGAFPNSVAVGDFNGDGILDLAVTDRLGSGVTGAVLLGNGDGSFRAAHYFASGSYPRSVAVGDFNGDGILDLAVASDGIGLNDGSVSVLLGNGDGSFRNVYRWNTGDEPTSMAVGDFNRDGVLDLAVAKYDSYHNNSVGVLLGNGDGMFQPERNFSSGFFRQFSVAVGDFNGDGIPDLALATSGTVNVLLGNGDGSFQDPQSYNAGPGTNSVAVGDFNGDGAPDLAVSNHDSNGNGTVSVLLNTERTSVTPTSLQWDTTQGGADYSYRVGGANLTQDTTVAMYWSSSDQFANRIGGPIYSSAIPAGSGIGSYGPFNVLASILGQPPQGAQYLLAVTDPNNVLGNFDPATNVKALSDWMPLGPAPIVNGQVAGDPTHQAVSGRVTGLAADPANPNVFYVATAGGGVWKTTNAGASWTPLTDHQPTEFMGAIAVAPSNPNVLYAGTGEANNSGDSFYGRGVLVSDDGGNTWALQTENGAFDRKAFSKIVVSPTNANLVYAAVADPGAQGLLGNNGIWRSTDGGASWINTTTGIQNVSNASEFTDLVIDPTNDQHLYCAIGTPIGDAANGIYETTDGGQNWRPAGDYPLGDIDGTIRLAISNSSPSTLYAVRTIPVTNSLLDIKVTTNGGINWRNTSYQPPDYLDGQGNYDNIIAVDPHNPMTIFVVGAFKGKDSNGNRINQILESTDGGGSAWKDITIGADGNGVHPDHHAMTFTAAGKLLDGNDGGVWELTNPTIGSITWQDLNTNLSTIQFYSIALDPNDPNVAYGGSQDNGTSKFSGSRSLSWNEIAGGDGGFVRVDFNNPQIVYQTFQRNQQTADRFIRRFDGRHWTNISVGINVNDKSAFYPPYVMDPTDSSRLVLGTDHIYETLNQGNSWTPIGTPSRHGFNPKAKIVTAIALAKTDSRTVYAATAGGDIWVTTDDGANWAARHIRGIKDSIPYLLVDPTNSQTVYAVRDRFGSGHVLKSTNGGQSWADISGNLPDLPAYALQLDTTNNVLYLGNDAGVWSSSNGGASWAPFGTGLPNAQVRELELNSTLQILAVGTHGRGLWEIPINQNPTAPTISASPSLDDRIVTFTLLVGVGGGARASEQTFETDGTTLGTAPLDATETPHVDTAAQSTHAVAQSDSGAGYVTANTARVKQRINILTSMDLLPASDVQIVNGIL